MNITLIGMPSCGKSTIGVVAAKQLGLDFVDCDLLIQRREGRKLKDIIRTDGLDAFMAIEEEVNSSLDVKDSVISPGGSVVLSEKAMKHLKEISFIIYLKVSYSTMCRRIGDPVKRGVVMRPGLTLSDLYRQREPLYAKYADLVIEERGLYMNEIVDLVVKQYETSE